MSPDTIQHIQHSFAKITPIAETAAELFYTKLFELDPNLKTLFKGDMKAQGDKLMQTLAVAVNELSNLNALIPKLEALGTRHVEYGVQDEHYDTVAAALLWTLEQGLGDDFTPACKAAWTEVYELMATVMKGAAAKVAA